MVLFVATLLLALACRILGLQSNPIDNKSLAYIKQQIHPVNKIGSGACAEVFIIDFGGIDHAMKCFDPRNRVAAPAGQREMEILRAVTEADAQFTVHLYAIFHMVDRVCYVIDLAQYTDLYRVQRVARQAFKKMPVSLETVGRIWAHQFVQATLKLHELGYLYKDVKLDNILLKKNGDIMISDFGLSQRPDELLKGSRGGGTVTSMPVEFFRREHWRYTKDSDWFGLGIALHEFYTGINPFVGNTFFENPADEQKQYLDNLAAGKYTLHLPEEFSEFCRDFIERCLQPLEFRIKDSQILDHPWFYGMETILPFKELWDYVFPNNLTQKRPYVPKMASSTISPGRHGGGSKSLATPPPLKISNIIEQSAIDELPLTPKSDSEKPESKANADGADNAEVESLAKTMQNLPSPSSESRAQPTASNTSAPLRQSKRRRRESTKRSSKRDMTSTQRSGKRQEIHTPGMPTTEKPCDASATEKSPVAARRNTRSGKNRSTRRKDGTSTK